MSATVTNGRRPWVGPVLALVTVSLGLSTLLYFTTLGREIADDPPALLSLVRNPFALFGDYIAAGFGHRWGSFPPLLPLLFGTLVAPWTWIAPDFWAIRLGV